MTFQLPNHQVKKKNSAYLIKTAEKAKQLGETQERKTISAQPGTSGKSDKKTNDAPETTQIRTCHSLSCEFTSDSEHVPFYHGQRAPLPKESNDLLDDHYIQSSSGGRLYAISKIRKRPAHSAPQEHRPSFENPRLYHKHKRKFFIDIDGHTQNVLDSDRKFFYPPDDRKSFYPSDYRKSSYPPDARKSFYPPNERKSFYPPDDRNSFHDHDGLKYFHDHDGRKSHAPFDDPKSFYAPDDRKSFYPHDDHTSHYPQEDCKSFHAHGGRKSHAPLDDPKSFYAPDDPKSFYAPDDRKSFYPRYHRVSFNLLDERQSYSTHDEQQGDDGQGEVIQHKDKMVQTTESQRFYLYQEALRAHNEKRLLHGVGPLKLSSELNHYAQHYADHLANSSIFKHSPCMLHGHRIGENLAYRWSSNHADYSDAVEGWYKEIKDYDFSKEDNPLSTTGHFTQLVWKATQEMGVGKAHDNKGQYFIVANYRPPGNLIGSFKKNVFPPVSRTYL